MTVLQFFFCLLSPSHVLFSVSYLGQDEKDTFRDSCTDCSNVNTLGASNSVYLSCSLFYSLYSIYPPFARTVTNDFRRQFFTVILTMFDRQFSQIFVSVCFSHCVCILADFFPR